MIKDQNIVLKFVKIIINHVVKIVLRAACHKVYIHYFELLQYTLAMEVKHIVADQVGAI